jgi:hypothetical protein
VEVLRGLRRGAESVGAARPRPCPAGRLRRVRPAAAIRALAVAVAVSAGAARAESPFTAVLAVRIKEPAREVPAKLVAEVTAHLQRTLRDTQVLNVSKGSGRFVINVSFPADERLKFEKMVVELPTVAFSTPVLVESWNINARTESSAATEDTTSSALGNFAIEMGASSGQIASVRLREVPVKDVLSFLARRARLQYMAPAEVTDRVVWAEARDVTVDEFLKGLKSTLAVDLVRMGPLYIFSRKE